MKWTAEGGRTILGEKAYEIHCSACLSIKKTANYFYAVTPRPANAKRG